MRKKPITVMEFILPPGQGFGWDGNGAHDPIVNGVALNNFGLTNHNSKIIKVSVAVTRRSITLKINRLKQK